jgi:predicted RND superfamily exporter protein
LTAALDRFVDLRSSEPAALRELETALTGTLPETMRGLRAMLSVTQPVPIADIPADLRREWVTPDGRARVQILPASDITGTEALESFARRVQTVAPEATGVPVDNMEAGAAVARAFLQAIAYTVVAVAIVIVLLRRSFVDLLLVLAPLALASLWTVAGATLLDLPFNFANVIAIPLLLGLGVASSIHMVVRAREAARGAIGNVLDTSTPLAVLVAQLNTAAAFATLAVAEHRGLFSMGVLLGLSIVFVLIAALIVLPAAMIQWDRLRVHYRRQDQGRGQPQKVIGDPH